VPDTSTKATAAAIQMLRRDHLRENT